jgi:DNA-binding SARP family transcriptional activator
VAEGPRPRLTLLGGFELRCDGEHVALSASAQRLLAFVALRERPLQRSYVAGSLWLDSAEERAAANLRSALWRLHGCGIQLVHCMGPQLSLDTDLVVDLREAEQLAHRVLDRTNGVDLDVDASLLSGDLLPDWYDDWVVFERERFHQLRLRALDALCGRLADAGRLDVALEIGLAAVADDPLRESSHRAVVRVHLADGNIAEAIRQYRLCRRLLNEQVGVEPSERMKELVRGVKTVR